MVKRWPDLPLHISKVDFRAYLLNLFEILQFRIAESAELLLRVNVTGSLASVTAECIELDTWFMWFR